MAIIEKAAARSTHSKCLMDHLRGVISQQEAADALGLSKESFKVAYHRFRQRLAKTLQEEVRIVVGPDENDIREEISYLMSVFLEVAP